MDFSQLGLSEKTIKAINEAGITSPTTVQADVIPSILAGKDVFTIAPSRCGKTCSYVFPLIDIISRKEAQNILIVTSGSKHSVVVSDSFAVFNKYHEITETTLTDSEEEIDQEANVIIASPNLLLDLIKEEKVDLSKINILVIDDINLIKKYHQLKSLETILEYLPSEKQNIIFTNRRSKETQDILNKILQTPEEIKVDKNKEEEAIHSEEKSSEEVELKTIIEELKDSAPVVEDKKSDKKSERQTRKNQKTRENNKDSEALSLMKKYRTFGRRTPEFMLTKVELADDNQ